jgi:hypothetical protein
VTKKGPCSPTAAGASKAGDEKGNRYKINEDKEIY